MTFGRMILGVTGGYAVVANFRVVYQNLAARLRKPTNNLSQDGQFPNRGPEYETGITTTTRRRSVRNCTPAGLTLLSPVRQAKDSPGKCQNRPGTFPIISLPTHHHSYPNILTFNAV